jgi:hypothetical protein
LLVSVIDPVAAPVVVGVYVALNVLVWPAVKVNGIASPAMAKPLPAGVAWEIVTLAEPPFVSVMACDPVVPTGVFPKTAANGFAVNWPCTPAPVRPITVGEDGALLMIVTLPGALPVMVGAKLAVNDALWPAATEIGSESPVTE